MYINLGRKQIFVWTLVLVILICVSICLALVTNKIEHGKKLVFRDNTLNISSYYAEYEATVISNKNTNTYFVKEWYKEGSGSRVEYLDSMKNTVTIVTTKEDVYISSKNNKLNFKTKNVYGTENILSLATYIDIFNESYNSHICGCAKNVYEKNGKISCVFDICSKEGCLQSDGIKHMGVTRFELEICDGVPSIYTVYTKNKNKYICIIYNKFESNIKIDESVFSINK